MGSYSLIEVVEIIEDDDGEVEPHQCEEEDAEEKKEPAAVTLKARGQLCTHQQGIWALARFLKPLGSTQAAEGRAGGHSRHWPRGSRHQAAPWRRNRTPQESSFGWTHATARWTSISYKLKSCLGQAGEDGPCGRTASFPMQQPLGAGWDFGHGKGQGARSCCLPAG